MKLVRSLLLPVALLCALALVATAVAKPKPIKPTAGTYVGTAKANGKTASVTGKVAKREGRTWVEVNLPFTYKCDDGSSEEDSVIFQAEARGKAFSTGASSAGTTYKFSGSFTTSTAFTATASKEGPLDVNVNGSPDCSTGIIKLSLHLKK
jgi:hypothetical protein